MAPDRFHRGGSNSTMAKQDLDRFARFASNREAFPAH
jgi:hypothetical protein